MVLRKENVYITRGLIIGTRSLRTTEKDFTHRWWAYVRSPFGTSLDFIQNVVYTLHETFENNVVTTINPFVIEEKGWGEFTLQIKIVFIDSNEKPITLYHQLLLHEGNKDDEGYLINERYEEIVFKSPTILMSNYLQQKEEKNQEFLFEEKKERAVIEYALERMIKKFEEKQ